MIYYDFKIFQESRLPLQESTRVLADKGYQGIAKVPKNSENPIKATKKQNLMIEEKKQNPEFSQRCIMIAHVNRYL